MNLTDLTKPVNATVVSEQIKTQFGGDCNIGKLKLKESVNLLNETNRMIVEFKQSKNLYESQNDASYMKLIMVNEAAKKRVTELTNNIQVQESDMNNRLLNKALKIAAKGGQLSEDQLKALQISESMKAVLRNKDTAQAFMRKIVESKKAAQQALLESEIGEAETAIAAKSIADQIQTMIEKFADIKYKELPALHDSIRNTQGVDAAQSFNDAVSASLDELTTSLETAKGDVNNAVAELTGQEVAPAAGDLDIDAIDAGEEEPADDLGDLDAELDLDGEAEVDAEFDVDLEADDEEVDLGRERR